MGEFYQDNLWNDHKKHPQAIYSQENPDPNDVRLVPPGKPVRLWPYVLAGLLMALCLWAYFEPIPEHTKIEPIGPHSSLYGPVK